MTKTFCGSWSTQKVFLFARSFKTFGVKGLSDG